MHAVAHSLAHRAPPATRARVRWQPYNPMPPSAMASSSTSHSSSSNSSPANSLNTPDSSVSSSPARSVPSCDIDPSRHLLSSSSSSSSSSSCPPTAIIKELPFRDAPPRNKHTLGLVDQAVKSLCEIWRPQDIPSVFLSSTGGLVSLSNSLDHARLSQQPSTSTMNPRTAQLPTAFPTAPSASSANATSSIPPTAPLQSTDTDPVPIKGFVHEVLRRSRTSGHVLQTALCYLEAIRPKIPEFAQKEKSGEAAQLEADLELRILPATDAELAQEQLADRSADATVQDPDAVMDTIRVSDQSSQILIAEDSVSKSSAISPLPRLPTPLLCPRRAFLAALILASKFTQDKCYSNRAWAKLSGLPAREIGRCERALGDALDWRLWVGKSSPSATTQRPMARSSSEASLFQSPSLISGERKTVVSAPADDAPSNTRRLRKCVTLPAEAFSTSKPISARTRVLREKFLPSAGLPCAFGLDSQGASTSVPLPILKLSPSSESTLTMRTTSVIPGTESFCPPVSFQQGLPQILEKFSQSPSPDTPGLSYSPSSSESTSGGDRTIQMSTFLDDNMGAFNASHSFASADPWQHLEDTSILSTQVAVGQGQFLPDSKMAWHSAPESYASVDTLLSKPGIYGPDMRGSYPREITGNYLDVGYSLHSD